jgi:hypothetical protein
LICPEDLVSVPQGRFRFPLRDLRQDIAEKHLREFVAAKSTIAIVFPDDPNFEMLKVSQQPLELASRTTLDHNTQANVRRQFRPIKVPVLKQLVDAFAQGGCNISRSARFHFEDSAHWAYLRQQIKVSIRKKY